MKGGFMVKLFGYHIATSILDWLNLAFEILSSCFQRSCCCKDGLLLKTIRLDVFELWLKLAISAWDLKKSTEVVVVSNYKVN